ncbi:MAG: hypothetical protein ACE5KE_12950, partial [Methanosarcinales archaeon]
MHLLSTLSLDAMSGVKYIVSVYNAVGFTRSLNLPEPWNTLSLISIPAALGTPYVLSLSKYYSKKLGVDLKNDLKYAGRRLFEGYCSVAYKLGEKLKNFNSR